MPPTFGIEIELLVACVIIDGVTVPFSCQDEAVTAPSYTLNIAKKLQAWFDTHPELDQSVQFPRPMVWGSPDAGQPRYEGWQVTYDESVVAMTNESKQVRETGKFDVFERENRSAWFESQADRTTPGVIFESVEIISPVLESGEHSFRVIERIYSEFLQQHSFAINEKCSLHVHVSSNKYAADGEIPFNTVKKLAQFSVCAAGQFACLVHPIRMLGYMCEPNTKALPIRSQRPNRALALLESFEASEQGEMAKLLTSDGTKYWAVNFYRFRPLLTSVVSRHAKTIEFRNGEATLSADRALVWINFIVDLFAAASNPEKSWEFLAKCNTHYSPEDLLMDLELEGYIGRLQVWRDNFLDFLDRVEEHNVDNFSKQMEGADSDDESDTDLGPDDKKRQTGDADNEAAIERRRLRAAAELPGAQESTKTAYVQARLELDFGSEEAVKEWQLRGE